MLKPKRNEIGWGGKLFMLGVLIFLFASTVRGGYLYLRDFINFIIK